MAYKEKTDAIKYNNQFIKQAYDRINLTVPKGQKDIIQAHAQAQGESVNGFIGRAISETMERDHNLSVAASIAKKQGVTIEEVLEAEEFARVLDRHPKIKAFVLGDTSAIKEESEDQQ